jgi:hypothetical protein
MLIPSTSYRLFSLNLQLKFPRFRTISGLTSSPSSAAEVRPARFSAPSPISEVRFELSPVPPNPLGEGRWIKTAGALIIGFVSLIELNKELGWNPLPHDFL